MSSVSGNYTSQPGNHSAFEENQNSDLPGLDIDESSITDEKDKRVAATAEAFKDTNPASRKRGTNAGIAAMAAANGAPGQAKPAEASVDAAAATEPPALTAAQKQAQKQAQQQMFATFADGVDPEVQKRLSTWLPDALAGDDKAVKESMGNLTVQQRMDLNTLAKQQGGKVIFQEGTEGSWKEAKTGPFDKKGLTELQQRFGEHALKASTPGLAPITSYDTGSPPETSKDAVYEKFVSGVDEATREHLAIWLPAGLADRSKLPKDPSDEQGAALTKLATIHGFGNADALLQSVVNEYDRQEALAMAQEASKDPVYEKFVSGVDEATRKHLALWLPAGLADRSKLPKDPSDEQGAALTKLATIHGFGNADALLQSVVTEYDRQEALAKAGELPTVVDMMLVQHDGKGSDVAVDVEVAGDNIKARVALYEKQGFGELDNWLPAALTGNGEIPKGDAAAMKLLGRFAEYMGLQGGATATPEAAFAYLKDAGTIKKALHPGTTDKDKSFLLFTDSFLGSTLKYGAKNGAVNGEMLADTANVAEMLLGPDDGTGAPRQLDVQALAAAVLHRTDQPLERQQELMAATGYINKAETLGEQKTRLAQSLLAFHVREEVGTAPMTARQWGESYNEIHPDLVGQLNERAFNSPTSQEMQIITAHLGVPGDHKFMIDEKRKIKLSNDELGNVESFDQSKKKTKWYKSVIDIAVPVIATALTFTGWGTAAGIALNAGYAAYKGAEAIKNGDWLGGALAIAGGVTGGAAGYLGSAAQIAGASAATVGAANTAATVARGVAVANGALNSYRAAQSGDMLGFVTSGLGTAAAGGAGGGFRTAATGINTARAIDSGDYLAAGAGVAGLAGDAASYGDSSAQYAFQGLEHGLNLADAIDDKNYAGIGSAASGLIQTGGSYQQYQQKQEELRLAQQAAPQPEQGADGGRGLSFDNNGDPAIRNADYQNGGGQAATSNIQVAPGDSLSRIATRHGTTVDDLMAANPGITDPNRIDAGQQLTLPPGVQPASTGRHNMLRDLANANGGNGASSATYVNGGEQAGDKLLSASQGASAMADAEMDTSLRVDQREFDQAVNTELTSLDKQIADIDKQLSEGVNHAPVEYHLKNEKLKLQAQRREVQALVGVPPTMQGQFDPPSASDEVRTGLFVAQHPVAAWNIGTADDGDNDISSRATRFSTRAPSPTDKNSVLSKMPDARGGEANAFRHVLWQAQISADYGAEIAKQAGDAHETNPNVDLTNNIFSNRGEADQAIDLLNNQIGRRIGTNNTGLPMNQTAKLALDEFKTNGFHMIKDNHDGTYSIEKKSISQQKYNDLDARFKLLDENGFDIPTGP